MINGKHGQGTHSTKMGEDRSTKNTPNAPKFVVPNCLPKSPQNRLHWTSVVRAYKAKLVVSDAKKKVGTTKTELMQFACSQAFSS